MSEKNLYTASRIFTGKNWLTDHVIITSKGLIEEIVLFSAVSFGQRIHHFDECIIAPAYIDLQIYGAGGKLFAVYPEPDSLTKLVAYCKEGGTAYCLPTVATNTREVFYACIDAVRKYWQAGGNGILGLHLEGPWINPVKRGAHIETLIHKPTIAEVEAMLEHGKGVIKMITLAPEVCTPEVLALIRSHDIIISAGHSDANYDDAKRSFTEGISAVTHLYNAMSPLHHRKPGLVGAAMNDDTVMASIIPDGYHVDYAAIRIAKQVMKERLFVITDAVTETTEGSYQHHISGDKYEAGGILSGSNLTMSKAVQNLVKFAGIEKGEAIRMASNYPAKVLGLENLGVLEPGKEARMVVLDAALGVKQMV